MANHIPPGAIPKLFRQRNKDGKEIGNWYIRIQQKPINLRTQDYMKARERAKEAWEGGKREFPDDRYTELQLAPIPKQTDLPQNAPPPVSTAPPVATGDWTADVASAAGAGLTPDAAPTPDSIRGERPEVIPPGQPAKEEKKKEADEDSTEIDPEMMEELTGQAAATAVELQLMLQAWLAAKGLKIQMGEVPAQSKARTIPAKIWQKWFKSMIPEDMPLPPYLAAPLFTLFMGVPVQLENATPIKPPEKKDEPPK